jgi:hypothetical protein
MDQDPSQRTISPTGPLAPNRYIGPADAMPAQGSSSKGSTPFTPRISGVTSALQPPDSVGDKLHGVT